MSVVIKTPNITHIERMEIDQLVEDFINNAETTKESETFFIKRMERDADLDRGVE